MQDLVIKLPEYLKLAGAIAVGLPALLAALVAFFMLIPGEQPEKFLQSVLNKLQGVVDIIKKFSSKKE